MKRTIFVVVVFAGFTVNIYANGYCDGRGNQ